MGNKIELLQGTLDMLILRTLQWGPCAGLDEYCLGTGARRAYCRRCSCRTSSDDNNVTR
jgi:hypothetical protein